MDKKEQKVVFSAEIDSKISGLALVLAFLSIGVFLLLFPDYFGNMLAASIIRWIFILIGLIGLGVELTKEKDNNLKGFDNFIIGIILVGTWAVFFIFINIWWVNIISFFILLIGLYGLYDGLLKIIYSAIQILKNHKETKKNLLADIVLLATKIAGLILVIIQIIKAFGFE